MASTLSCLTPCEAQVAFVEDVLLHLDLHCPLGAPRFGAAQHLVQRTVPHGHSIPHFILGTWCVMPVRMLT